MRGTGIPAPLMKKILYTGILGTGCLLFGLVYFFCTKDHVLLYLSLLLFGFCAWKVRTLYQTIRQDTYEVVEGTCIGVKQKHLFGKFQTVRIQDADGNEAALRLAKTCKVKIGETYRFYFLRKERISTGNDYLDTFLASEGFLGYERLRQ